MHARSFLALTAAVFLCSALPAGAQGEQEKQLQLPDGDGKAIVQNRCSACHGLNMLPNQSGSTAEQWQKVFSTMVALPGDQPTVVSNYLAKSFPVKGKPDAVIVPGNATVSIKELLLPTLGQRPHDPLSTPDGNIWWTGMFANVVGAARSEDRRDEGIPVEDRGLGPSWPGGRQGWQHLVHGEPEGP